MKLYLDEDISPKIAEKLREEGFDVISTHEVSNRELRDEEQLTYATSQKRFLVTYNRNDFLSLANLWYQNRISFYKILIILERRYPRSDFGAQIAALKKYLKTYAANQNIENCVNFV